MGQGRKRNRASEYPTWKCPCVITIFIITNLIIKRWIIIGIFVLAKSTIIVNILITIMFYISHIHKLHALSNCVCWVNMMTVTFNTEQ